MTFSNVTGLPQDLVPLLVNSPVCIYTSIKRDGTPIASPLIPIPGEEGRTIDINTGLTYPWKAERTRSNPRVCLLYSEPDGSPIANSPVVLVYGQATVYDADLQANTDRYVRLALSRFQMFRSMPSFLYPYMTAYLARIWIAVTPLKVLWRPGGDVGSDSHIWFAPEDTQTPPSDPPPKPLLASHKPGPTPSTDWRKDMVYALDQLGIPILTVVDEEGYPVAFRVLGGYLESDGVRLDLLPSMPTTTQGRACLAFHTLRIQQGEMVENENMSFVGDLSGSGGSVHFKVERRLTSVSMKRSLRGVLSVVLTLMGFRKRLKAEAARRDQPVPEIHYPKDFSPG